LEEIAREDELDAAKGEQPEGLGLASAGDEIEFVEEGRIEHGDLVDDEHLAGSPPGARDRSELLEQRLLVVSPQPDACEGVDGLAVDVQRGDAGGGGDGDCTEGGCLSLSCSMMKRRR
jgi:hypothetical protein